MTTEHTITNERIDDFPLLLGTMQRLELPAILDRHLTRHGLQQGLSWGDLAGAHLVAGGSPQTAGAGLGSAGRRHDHAHHRAGEPDGVGLHR